MLFFRWWAVTILILLAVVHPAFANMPTSVKNETLRKENSEKKKYWLVIPYAFSSESMGLTFGLGFGAWGYFQDQLNFAGTVFSSNNEVEGEDDAYGVILGMWDLRIPYTQRFFFSANGSYGYYPRKRAYSAPTYDPGEVRPGSNDSSADQFIEVGGEDNWSDFKLEYVLPMGAAKNKAILTYRLEHGLLTSTPTGGRSWNPLTSGVTHFLIRQYNRYQTYEVDPGDLDRAIHPVQFALSYDNTDFPKNPSYGSRQYIAMTRDFGWLESADTWTFVEAEGSKFFSLGDTKWARQRVVAVSGWTADTPTWNESPLDNGQVKVNNAPPYYEGSTLGGFYRMRAYPFYRFNDRSTIYASAEYRYTPRWNPISEVRWLRFLKMDWWQAVAFYEGGRVARHYSFSELTSDWKTSVGIGLRAMAAGAVVRFDFAYSNEGSSIWFMVNHPF